MRTDTPQAVDTSNGLYRCVRLSDGRFHLYRPGPLSHLFYGGDLILASEAFAGVLHETCTHCLNLRRTELVQIRTGELFGIYYEVLPHDELTPDNVDQIRPTGFHAWHYQQAHLFVSPAVVELIRQRSFDDLRFSPPNWCAGPTDT